MSIFVPFADDGDQVGDIASYYARVLKKGDEVKNGDKQAVVATLVSLTPELIEAAPESDVEGAVNVLLMLICQFENVDLAHQLSKVVSQSTESKTELRLKLVSNVVNMFPRNHAGRYDAFMVLLKYALATEQPAAVLPITESVDTFLAEWGVNNAQKRVVFHIIADLHKAAGNAVSEYDTLVKAAKLYDDGEQPSADEVNTAKRATLLAVGQPTIFKADTLLNSVPGRALESADSATFNLLSVFVLEDVAAFQAFAAANAAYFTTQNLDQDAALAKMRVLTLATVVSGQKEVQYARIAEALQVDENEVESWVVRLITLGLLEARMDQMRGVVVVDKLSLTRSFGTAEWEVVQQKLLLWKEGLQNVLEVVHSQKAAHRMAQTLA